MAWLAAGESLLLSVTLPIFVEKRGDEQIRDSPMDAGALRKTFL
jgi:hypothetical protein